MFLFLSIRPYHASAQKVSLKRYYSDNQKSCLCRQLTIRLSPKEKNTLNMIRKLPSYTIHSNRKKGLGYFQGKNARRQKNTCYLQQPLIIRLSTKNVKNEILKKVGAFFYDVILLDEVNDDNLSISLNKIAVTEKNS